MEKPLERLRQEIAMPDVARVIRRPVRPDRLSILIGKAVAYVLSDPAYAHLLPPDTLETQLQVLQHVTNVRRFRKNCLTINYREWVERIEAKTFPGIIAHTVLRKRKIEDWARRAIAQGVRQVVSFDAGFDTLLIRLAREFPDIVCIETDLIATLRPKMAALQRKPPNLHFVDLNLQEPFLETVMLAHPAFRDKERTFFIAEGNLYFLSDDDVDRIFTFIQDHAGQRSHLAISFLERGVDHVAVFPELTLATDFLLRLFRVQFGWGLRYEHAATFLNDRYHAMLEIDTAADLRRKAPPPIPPGPEIARADMVALGEFVFND